MKFFIEDTQIASATENMEKDKNLLNNLDPNGIPILHLYKWSSDSVTYGHFAKKEDLLDLNGLEKYKIDAARRVTGGGVTLHFSDYAFSFFMPKSNPLFSENTLDNYAFVNQVVANALGNYLPKEDLLFQKQEDAKVHSPRSFFCMARPTQYDVLYKDKKIAGAAQRKTKSGYLHHGSIAVARPNPVILKAILKDKEQLYHSILQHHHAFVEDHLEKTSVNHWRKKIEEALIEAFKSA